MIRTFASAAAIIVFFFLCLFIFVKVATPIAFSTSNPADSFAVTGEGKASAVPDSATVRVSVRSTGENSDKARSSLNETVGKVVTGIKALGIEDKDIQTANFNINPEYDYRSQPARIVSYRGDTTLTIKTKDTTLANKVIDTATQNGASQIGGVDFNVVDRSAAEQEARLKAVEDAKKKAQLAAQAGGFKLGKVVGYSEGSNVEGPILYDRAMTLNKVGGGTPTQVEPGTNEVTISVTLSYEIK